MLLLCAVVGGLLWGFWGVLERNFNWVYFLQPLTSIHLRSHLLIGEFEANSSAAYVDGGTVPSSKSVSSPQILFTMTGAGDTEVTATLSTGNPSRGGQALQGRASLGSRSQGKDRGRMPEGTAQIKQERHIRNSRDLPKTARHTDGG